MADKKTEVSPAPADKPLSTADVKLLMKEAFQEGMALNAALQVAKPDPFLPPSIQNAQGTIPKGMECGECHQYRSACKGEHEMIVVFPQNRKLGKRGHGFVGVHINGVQYRSNGPTHKVCVPKGSDIRSILANWEKNEEDLDQDVGVMRNSANLSPRRQNRIFRGY